MISFISLRRVSANGSDQSTLGFGGRTDKPGHLRIIGGLPHDIEILPASESDRLALIRFLQSEECFQAVRNLPPKE